MVQTFRLSSARIALRIATTACQMPVGAGDGFGSGVGAGSGGNGCAGAVASMAIAAARTLATRLLQPVPNVDHVPRDLRNASRVSPSALMTPTGSAFAAAASVTGPMTPSTGTPRTDCRSFAALDGPEFTASSKTA